MQTVIFMGNAFLKLILIFSIAGLLFSGYLSYYNVFVGGCSETIISCGGPDQVLIFGLPTCVLGFFMYLAVSALSLIGLMSENKRKFLKIIFGLGLFGAAFAGFLSFYEIYILNINFTGIPACVVGLVIYAFIAIISGLGLRVAKKTTIN